MKVPNTYVIIFTVIIVCAVMTWFVPGGEYIDGVFQSVESAPQTWQVFSALFKGFAQQAEIIAFVLIVGGAFWVLNSTKAVDDGVTKFISVASRLEKYAFVRSLGVDNIVIVSIMLLFGVFGAVFGMSEETIAFVAVVMPLALKLGYDRFTAVCMVYVAAHVGFAGAMLNPFTVGIAQNMSGLPLFSGIEYRTFCWAVLMTVTIAGVLLYARRIRTAPAAISAGQSAGIVLGRRKVLILSVLALTVVALVVGVTHFGWYISEIAALFMAMAIVVGLIAGYGPERIAQEFVAGAKDIFGAALVIGFAAGIIVILRDGKIIDTMLNAMASRLDGSGKVGATASMYAIQTLINIFIPSASAKAAITMPIMAPFSDLIGLSRQVTVLAFQFGDGITNMITPCSGVLLAVLSVAKIPYGEWFRFAWKFILALVILCFLLLLPALWLELPGF